MPSSSFLMSPTDLTTRFCYVNFEVSRSENPKIEFFAGSNLLG